MNHIHAPEDATSYDMGSVYPGDSLPVFRALVSTVETARGISILLTTALSRITGRVAQAVREMEAAHGATFPSLEEHGDSC